MSAAACSFDPNTTSETPGSGADAANPTLGAASDASASEQATDADAGRGDNTPTDQKADAGSFDTVLPTCQKMYGAATNFDLCEETANSCRFYVVTNEDTCTNLCQSFGGACIDNYDGNCASGIGSQGCNIVHQDQVCICSRPATAITP